jgi:hypothetical protein
LFDATTLIAYGCHQFPRFVRTPLEKLVPNASKEALELMTDLLTFDPAKRPTAAQVHYLPHIHHFAVDINNNGNIGITV